MTDPSLTPILQRIAEALERFAPVPAGKTDFASADAFVWRAERSALDVRRQKSL